MTRHIVTGLVRDSLRLFFNRKKTILTNSVLTTFGDYVVGGIVGHRHSPLVCSR